MPLTSRIAAALLLGVLIGAARWLDEGSLNGDGAAGVVITLSFHLGGVLFARLGGGRLGVTFV